MLLVSSACDCGMNKQLKFHSGSSFAPSFCCAKTEIRALPILSLLGTQTFKQAVRKYLQWPPIQALPFLSLPSWICLLKKMQWNRLKKIKTASFCSSDLQQGKHINFPVKSISGSRGQALPTDLAGDKEVAGHLGEHFAPRGHKLIWRAPNLLRSQTGRVTKLSES